MKKILLEQQNCFYFDLFALNEHSGSLNLAESMFYDCKQHNMIIFQFPQILCWAKFGLWSPNQAKSKQI